MTETVLNLVPGGLAKIEPGCTYAIEMAENISFERAAQIKRDFAQQTGAAVILVSNGSRFAREQSSSTSVLQPWVEELTMMQQSVLLTAVRGPDGLPKYHPTKWLLRWYRRCILRSSFLGSIVDNPTDLDGGSFLGPSLGLAPVRPGCDTAERVFYETGDWRIGMHERVTEYLQALDEVPHHFQLHLMHSAEIVGYKHPDLEIRTWWLQVYERLVHDMHLWPETEAQLDARLGDSREGWLARADRATVK